MGRGRFDHDERAEAPRDPGRSGDRPQGYALRCWLSSCSEHPCLPLRLARPRSSNRSETHSRRSRPAPVANSGDAADDIAIWRNPLDPAASLVIGNDKLGALETYDLSGSLVQRFDGGFYGNVDTRTGIQTGRGPVDVAVTYRLGIRIYGIDPTTRQLSNITDSTSGSIASPIGGEGICLYKSGATGSLYVFMNTRDGRIAQMRLADADGDGLIEGTVVRQWDVGEEVEGCVADDDLGNLYISEEDVAIWKYGAEPTAPTSPDARMAVDRPIAAGGISVPTRRASRSCTCRAGAAI